MSKLEILRRLFVRREEVLIASEENRTRPACARLVIRVKRLCCVITIQRPSNMLNVWTGLQPRFPPVSCHAPVHTWKRMWASMNLFFFNSLILFSLFLHFFFFGRANNGCWTAASVRLPFISFHVVVSLQDSGTVISALLLLPFLFRSVGSFLHARGPDFPTKFFEFWALASFAQGTWETELRKHAGDSSLGNKINAQWIA